MQFTSSNDLAMQALLVGLGIILFVLVVLLIVVIESVILQLFRWGDFKGCLKGALWMNLASSLFGFVCLVLIPVFGRWLLGVAWVVSVVVEALVLNRLQPKNRRLNWMISTLANLTSYLIVIAPAT